MKRKFTKYPSGYVKASDEPHIVKDNEIVDVYLCDGSYEGYPEDSFYMNASTQFDDIIIHCKRGNYPSRYDYTYVMESDSEGLLYEHALTYVLREFFKRYEVDSDYSKEIKEFASKY